MRICLYNLTTGFVYRGIETWNIEIARELAKLGIEVDIVTGKSKNMRSDFVFNDPKIRVLEFPFLDIPMSPLLTHYSMMAFALIPIIRQEYDFVIIHKLYDALLAKLVRKFSKKTRVLAVQHGIMEKVFKAYFIKDLDGFIAVSGFIKKDLEKHGIESSVVYGGVDTQKFRPKKQSALEKKLRPNGEKIVFSSVALKKWKGVQHLLEAFPIVESRFPKAKLVIAGKGPYKKALLKLAKDLNLRNSEFIGEIPYNEMADYYNASDVCADPAHGEAFGLGICEAMSCEKPVISAKNGGTLEIIEEGVSGFFFEDRNSIELAEKIARLLEKPGLAEKLGRQGRKTVAEKFTWENSAKAMQKALLKKQRG